ncbi:MAG TPA: M14 family zinc carboxypeptidase [Solirubrobacteraceae bacterium]|nr:M14 family zinc carboxypeptidase [Solirubrobacteraceae bacterium]
MSRLRRLLPASLCLVAVAAPAPAADAAPLLRAAASADSARLRTCHARLLSPSQNVKHFRATSADTGLLVARLSGGRGGDWDVAVFGGGGRGVAAAAGPTSREVASGFVAKGEQLTVQACLVRGGRSAATVTLSSHALPASASTAKAQILAVDTPTAADRNRLMALGFDDTHSHTSDTLDVLVTSDAEIEKLRAAGFTWKVEAGDLVARERERATLDLDYAKRTKRSGLPSGRDEYRRLADYEAELKRLAEKHPGLVKLITLPHKSLEGRDVVGVEIAQNVNVKDGRPVFVQFGVHHAREWPAGEHPMEWAYELATGYGKSDRVTKLVNATRTIVVPIVNPDGFNLSREAPVNLGNAAAMIDLPPEIDEQLPLPDPTYMAVLIADPYVGFAYKRRNCRTADGRLPAEGECASRGSRNLGVDPNRNYGGFWGGPGASLDPTVDTYRGEEPFSEPEVDNGRKLMSAHQVVTMITNHTFSNLILRPPGIRNEGSTPDEPIYKALGDKMASNNGYSSQYGYQLYDTTGTTEDWSYQATGGFGFTFEIGPDEFHPPFEEVVSEYEGAGEYQGKGNREAYFVAQEHTADAANHSVLEGTAPAGTVLRLHKEFISQTSPIIKSASGETERPVEFKDVLDTTLEVGDDGKFRWHVNPSTRPYVRKDRKFSGVAEQPAFEEDFSSSVPVAPGVPRHIEFEVKPDAARQVRAQMSGAGPDYDMYLYYGEVNANNQVASSAGPDANETISYGFPAPGKYILEIENYSAISPYDGKVQVFGDQPGTEEVTKATTEAWTLTCERPDGTVLAERKVEVERGQVKALGAACKRAMGTADALKLRVRVKRARLADSLKRGLAATVVCSRACRFTAQVRVDKRTAKRLRIRGPVARTRAIKSSGRKAIRVRFSRDMARKLKRARGARFSVVVTGRDELGNVRRARGAARLR